MNDDEHGIDEYRGYKITSTPDYDPIDPREWDNVGTMVCKHRNYDLGDVQIIGDVCEWFMDQLDPEYEDSELHEMVPNNETLSVLMDKFMDDKIWLPLYLLEHSGIWMRTHNFSDCDPGQWDSGQVGFIYTTIDKAIKEGFVKDDGTVDKIRVLQCLKGEVKIYSDYISGNVCCVNIYDPEDNMIDSSCGFYGNDEEYMMSEAKWIIDNHIERKIKEHSKKLKSQITKKVPLEYREPVGVTR